MHEEQRPSESRVRENRMHGSMRGGWEDACRGILTAYALAGNRWTWLVDPRCASHQPPTLQQVDAWQRRPDPTF